MNKTIDSFKTQNGADYVLLFQSTEDVKAYSKTIVVQIAAGTNKDLRYVTDNSAYIGTIFNNPNGNCQTFSIAYFNTFWQHLKLLKFTDDDLLRMLLIFKANALGKYQLLLDLKDYSKSYNNDNLLDNFKKLFKPYIKGEMPYESSNTSTMSLFLIDMRKIVSYLETVNTKQNPFKA